MDSTPIQSMDSYISINSIDFGEVVLFIKFGTDWCAPCNKMSNVLAGISNSIVYTVDVENEDFEEYLATNNIYNIPTVIIKYKSNTTQFVGMRTTEEINNMIHTLKTRYQGGKRPCDF